MSTISKTHRGTRRASVKWRIFFYPAKKLCADLALTICSLLSTTQASATNTLIINSGSCQSFIATDGKDFYDLPGKEI